MTLQDGTNKEFRNVVVASQTKLHSVGKTKNQEIRNAAKAWREKSSYLFFHDNDLSG
jgi:hypothetical protein